MRPVLLVILLAACGDSRAERTAPAAEDPAAPAAPDEAYDRHRRPDALVDALKLEPGARVADVGAGTGYLTSRLAARAAHVVATDIDQAALARIPRATNVETRHVEPDDPGLEPGAYDVILLAQVDQYLNDRVSYFARLKGSLAPGGRIAISNRSGHRKGTLAAAEAAGLRLVEDVPGFPAQYLLIFDAGAADGGGAR